MSPSPSINEICLLADQDLLSEDHSELTLDAQVEIRQSSANDVGFGVSSTNLDGITLSRDFGGFVRALSDVDSGSIQVVVGDFVLAESQVYTSANNQPADSITALLKTSTLYIDNQDIDVRYSLRDARGRSAVLRSGLTVRNKLTIGSDVIAVSCSAPNARKGTGNCRSSGILASHFSADQDVTVSGELQVFYESDGVLNFVVTSEVST